VGTRSQGGCDLVITVQIGNATDQMGAKACTEFAQDGKFSIPCIGDFHH
jgi:hypothetical protein